MTHPVVACGPETRAGRESGALSYASGSDNRAAPARARQGGRRGSNPRREDHDLECSRYTTATMGPVGVRPPRLRVRPFGGGRATGTAGFEPAASRLTNERSDP